MADLFLSYAREDRECAEVLAAALTKRGRTVWWDRHIKAGTAFSNVIEKELDRARCVIVLWSRHSVASNWVRNEASEAAQRNVLVPVRIEDVKQPIDFRHLQTADLFGWRDSLDSPEFEDCISAIDALVAYTVEMSLPGRTANPILAAAPKRPAAVEKPVGDEFWISQDGAQFRAPDTATLRKWAEEGRVRPDSYVYHRLFERWIPAREVPSLQGAYARSAITSRVAAVPAVSKPFLIRQDGDELTVPDLQTLCLWASEGRVDLGSRVFDPRRERWVYAKEIPEFWNAYRMPSRDRVRNTAGPRPLLLVLGLGAVLFIALLSMTMFGRSPKTPPTETVAPAAQPVAISIENRCTSKTIDVAIGYLNGANTWVTTGWHTLRPRQTKTNVVQAMGPDVYFYGVSGKSTWHGEKNDPLTRDIPIDKAKNFDSAIAQLKGKSVKSVPFLGRRIVAGQTAFTQSLTCE